MNSWLWYGRIMKNLVDISVVWYLNRTIFHFFLFSNNLPSVNPTYFYKSYKLWNYMLKMPSSQNPNKSTSSWFIVCAVLSNLSLFNEYPQIISLVKSISCQTMKLNDSSHLITDHSLCCLPIRWTSQNRRFVN